MKALIKHRFILMAAVVLSGLSLSSCQSSTPASRIAAHPAMFSALPPAQQSLVRQGRLAEGMSRDAVFLAWGKPNGAPYQAYRNGKNIERWYYKGYQPITVMNDGLYPPFYDGYGWGAYTPYYSSSTMFVPRNVAYAEFINGKLKAWAQNLPD
ncbi:MAG: hypothetical protein Q4F38_06585 [Akkermansia sp.]|nr:hypothetical protein [Akkermansia sp.]